MSFIYFPDLLLEPTSAVQCKDGLYMLPNQASPSEFAVEAAPGTWILTDDADSKSQPASECSTGAGDKRSSEDGSYVEEALPLYPQTHRTCEVKEGTVAGTEPLLELLPLHAPLFAPPGLELLPPPGLELPKPPGLDCSTCILQATGPINQTVNRYTPMPDSLRRRLLMMIPLKSPSIDPSSLQTGSSPKPKGSQLEIGSGVSAAVHPPASIASKQGFLHNNADDTITTLRREWLHAPIEKSKMQLSALPVRYQKKAGHLRERIGSRISALSLQHLS